jgi:nitrogen fixation/metabolism regulation signal transduction histidine kinase
VWTDLDSRQDRRAAVASLWLGLQDLDVSLVTTRLDAHGTGLGLTVAQGIVTQHGGSITASNRKEGGACLEVWLPVAVSR